MPDAKKWWTRDAWKSCPMDSGRKKMWFGDAKRHYEHRRQTPQKILNGRWTPAKLPPRTPDAKPIPPPLSLKLFPHWTLTIKFIWFCPAAYRSFVHFSSSSCFWTNARVHNKNRQLRLITCLHNPEAMSHENFRKYCHSWYCYLLSFHPRKFIF